MAQPSNPPPTREELLAALRLVTDLEEVYQRTIDARPPYAPEVVLRMQADITGPLNDARAAYAALHAGKYGT